MPIDDVVHCASILTSPLQHFPPKKKVVLHLHAEVHEECVVQVGEEWELMERDFKEYFKEGSHLIGSPDPGQTC